MDISNLSTEQLFSWMEFADIDQIRAYSSQLSKDQIFSLIIYLNETDNEHGREKTRAIIEGLVSPHELETAGRALNVKQALDLISLYPRWDNSQQIKLQPLLVGMTHHTFMDVLQQASSNHLEVLKHESMTEPMQHQLVLLYHEAVKQTDALEREYAQLESEISTVSPEKLGLADRLIIEDRILSLTTTYQPISASLDKGLGIAWNTGRPDIISNLSSIKERLQRLISMSIGNRSQPNFAASGLYATLEKRLFAAYGDPSNTQDVQALKDEDSAMEGISRLGVWYLDDYLKLGLLPSQQGTEKLHLEDYDEEERAKYRGQLFLEAETNLKNAGLATVLDLKRASIFSKQALVDYLTALKKLR